MNSWQQLRVWIAGLLLGALAMQAAAAPAWMSRHPGLHPADVEAIDHQQWTTLILELNTAIAADPVAVATAGSDSLRSFKRALLDQRDASRIDTFLAVYQGNDLASLTWVAASDDANVQDTSALDFYAVAGLILPTPLKRAALHPIYSATFCCRTPLPHELSAWPAHLLGFSCQPYLWHRHDAPAPGALATGAGVFARHG